MDVDVLFVGVAVTDFGQARAWYERFFGRAPDVVAHETEVMWRVRDPGWLYILRDPEHAGSSFAALAVSDLEAATAELIARGVETGSIEAEGEGALKALVRDPDGNLLSLLEVAAGGG